MDLQDATILYIVLILPIILILSFSLSLSISEIRAEIDYQNKLLDATRDGIKAFELNTANEEFRNVTDALKTLVEASINTFKDGYAKRLGMGDSARSRIDNYVPFTIFTLNDGYYINSPSFTPHVLTYKVDGMGVHVDGVNVNLVNNDKYSADQTEYEKKFHEKRKLENLGKNGQNKEIINGIVSSDAKPILYQLNEKSTSENIDYGTINPVNESVYFDRTNVLKNFIPYSARYNNGETDVIISYSMDNYISVIGKKGKKYFSRSGYLLDPKIELEVKGLEVAKTSVPESRIDRVIDHLADEVTLTLKNVRREYPDVENNIKEEFLDIEIKYDPKPILDMKLNETNTDTAYFFQQKEAIKYYLKAYNFTKWVYNELSDLKIENMQINMPKDILDTLKNTNKFTTMVRIPEDVKGEYVFNKDRADGYDISKKDSTYNFQKKVVMRNSIQYNIYVAASNYSKYIMSSDVKKSVLRSNIQIPIISPTDWEIILEDISMVTFTHGLKTPKGQFSSYAVVSSGDNEFTIKESGLYFVLSQYFDKGATKEAKMSPEYKYHKITCPDLSDVEAKINKEELIGYVGDLINNFEYDGKKLTAIEKRNANLDEQGMYAEVNFVRKNFKCLKCITQSDINNENLSLLGPEKKIRADSLYSAIGAKKERRYNIIKIIDDRIYEIIDPKNKNIKLSTVGDYTPSIKTVELVIKRPKLETLDSGPTANYNQFVNFDIVLSFPDGFEYVRKSSISTVSKDGSDEEYQDFPVFNLESSITPSLTEAAKRTEKNEDGTFKYDGNFKYYGTGPEVKIDLIPEEDSYKGNLEIVEIRVDYS